MYEINAWDEDDFSILLNGSSVENYEAADVEELLDFVIAHPAATFAFGSGPEMSAAETRAYLARQYGAFRS